MTWPRRAILYASLDQDLASLNPSLGKDLARLNPSFGRQKGPKTLKRDEKRVKNRWETA